MGVTVVQRPAEVEFPFDIIGDVVIDHRSSVYSPMVYRVHAWVFVMVQYVVE